MATMMLITQGTAGDILPFVGLGAALAATGHEVIVLTHSPYRRVVADAGLAFRPIDTDAEYTQELRHHQKLKEGLFRTPGTVAEHFRQSNWFRQIRRALLVTPHHDLLPGSLPPGVHAVGRRSGGGAAAAERGLAIRPAGAGGPGARGR